MTPLKNKLISLWIMLFSAASTIYYATCIFGLVLSRRINRERGNACIRGWALSLLKVAKVQYDIKNPGQLDFTQPLHNTIVMCNHTSLYDIPLSLVALPTTLRMIAKKELSRVPFLGKAMAQTEFIFIDRHNRNQSLMDLEQAKEKMRSGVTLWICPEGTRSENGNLLPFKKGGFMMALETGATIIPVGIRGAANIVKKNTFRFHRHVHVEVHIGKPIEASQYSLKTRNVLVNDVRQAILEASGITVPSLLREGQGGFQDLKPPLTPP